MQRNRFSIIFILFLAVLVGCKDKKETKKGTRVNTDTTEVNPKPDPEERSKKAEAVKATLERLFVLSKKGDHKTAATYLLDQSGKKPLDYKSEKNQIAVTKACAQLEVILQGVDKTDYKEFVIERESEGDWHIWIVQFFYEDGTSARYAFAFLSIPSGFVLGDVEEV